MQKIRKTYWKKFNPVGDTLQAKIAITQRSLFSGAADIPHIQLLAPDYPNLRIPRLTDPVGLMGRFGVSSLGRSMANTSSLLAATVFRRYKCKGVGGTITVTPQFGTTPPSPTEQSRRFIIAVWANSDNNVVGGTVSGPSGLDFSTIIPEQRWVKWKYIQSGFLYGGRATKLRFYFNVNRVFGPDRVVKGDEDFTGRTDTLDSTNTGFSSLLPNRPVDGPGLQMMIYSVDGLGYEGGTLFNVQVDWTFYIKYFNKHQNTSVTVQQPLLPIQ